MQKAVVYLVDDDRAVRKALERVIASAGFSVHAWGTAREFLQAPVIQAPSCLVVDLQMPDLDGLELQGELARVGRSLPLVFISGEATVPDSVQAMKAGAVDFLSKPVSTALLLEAITRALESDRVQRAAEARRVEVQGRYESLTLRERQVFGMVVQGRLNKQIGFAIGIAEKTVKSHRARVMEKMQAQSLPDLVRLAELLPDLHHRAGDDTASDPPATLASHAS